MNRLNVLVSMRGKRIAHRLTEKMFELAKKVGATKIVAVTTIGQSAAIRFYTKTGWFEEQIVEDIDGWPWSFIESCIFGYYDVKLIKKI